MDTGMYRLNAPKPEDQPRLSYHKLTCMMQLKKTCFPPQTRSDNWTVHWKIVININWGSLPRPTKWEIWFYGTPSLGIKVADTPSSVVGASGNGAYHSHYTHAYRM